jgi:hypothetical protein
MLDHPIVFFETSDGVLVAPPVCGLLTVPDLVSHVTAWCARPSPGELLVDLSRTAVIEFEVLRALLWASQRCAAAGTGLAVRLAPRGVLTQEQEDVIRRRCRVVGAEAPEPARSGPRRRTAVRPHA